MKKIRNVYVVGLGAIGGAYASKIYEAQPDTIKVIANEERIERYSREGFDINGKRYDFNYISPQETGEPADLILVAVKYHQLEETIEDMRNFIGPDTKILSLMNGINSEEIIGKEFGIEKMLYGLCVAIDGVRVGTTINYTNIGKIIFGNKENDSNSQDVIAVKNLLDQANIPNEIPENIMKSLWWKFMINVGINQVSAILKAPYGVFCSIGEARELMEASMKEVVTLSQKLGVNLVEDDMEEFFILMKSLSPEGKTSMHQDIEARRKTEVEMFAGVVSELGRKHDVPTPVNDMLYRMIRTLEKMY